jgi:membrane protein implicated in regulation of membrane protease activity
VLGAGYILLSTFLGHAFHGDTPGHDAAVGDSVGVDYGGDGHGTATAADHAAPAFHFPFFSPLALAAVFGSLGAFGLIAQLGFGARDETSLLVAIPASIVTSYFITYVAWRLLRASVGSSQIRAADLRGARAEVLTPIPAGGVGEVAAYVGGQRFNAPAREQRGRPAARGTHVVVKEAVGHTLVVSVSDDEQ